MAPEPAPKAVGDGPTPRPSATVPEREEVAGIAYFLAQWEALHARGLFAEDIYRTIAEEYAARRAGLERTLRFRSAMERARGESAKRPDAALEWAAEARRIDPEAIEPWVLALDLLERLRRYGEAIALGDEAVGRFPELEGRLARLWQDRERSQVQAVDSLLKLARSALDRRADREVIDLLGPKLETEPDDADALVLVAFARQRLGHLDEALALYRRLHSLQPANPVWATWEQSILRRQGVAAGKGKGKDVEEAGLSWSGVAGEFLQEHWQKLLLGLAVLLIMVSSTIGAQVLLGPRLWSPVGKCALALVYTLMFAGLGWGLRRWGAERAGRLVLGTMLAVVPIHFMLLGEMRLLTSPDPAGLLVLALDTAALIALTRRVVAALGLPGGWFLSAALIGLGACNALTTRGVPFSWGLATLWLLGALYVASVIWINARVEGGEGAVADADRIAADLLGLGLLTFAFLAGTLRTGGFVLQLVPALYEVPTMLAAIAGVQTARHLARLGDEPRRVALLRFVGLVLSGLAFALALSRPPGPSPLYSGNTLITAVLGLALYATSLHAERQPAYLYFAFGALFLGYFGAFYFVHDLVRAVEEAARQALGYRTKLPEPFKAINGLVFNTLLALLALAFRRRWQDDRLSRHCHYLGVPFSVAACLVSCLEPKAALICLSGYAVLYAIATRVFAQPWLIYLACATTTGAAYFAATLVHGMTLAALALGASGLGCGLRAVASGLAARSADLSYQRPLHHAALALAVLSLVLAAASTAVLPGGTPALTLALVLVAGLAAWLVGDLTHAAIAHLSAVAALGAWLCAIDLATAHGLRTVTAFGLAAVTFAPVLLLAAGWARTRGRTVRAESFARALPDFLTLLVVFSDLLAAVSFHVEPAVALVLLIGAVTLLGLTWIRREVELVYAGLGLAVASALVLGAWRVGWSPMGVGIAWLSLIGAALAVALVMLGAVGRRRGWGAFYADPCFQFAGLLSTVAIVTAIAARLDTRDAFPMSLAALLLDGLVCALLAAAWRRSSLTAQAILSIVAALYLTLFSIGRADPSKAYVLGLAGVLLGLLFWALAFACRRFCAPEWGAIYARPLEVATVGLTAFAFLPAHDSAVSMLLATVALLLLVRSFPATGWLYPACVALGLAVYHGTLRDLAEPWLIVAALAGAFALWGLGMLTRRTRPALCRRLGLADLPYDRPLLDAAIVASLIAAGLRVRLGAPWTAHAALPIALGLFCALMYTARPRRGWVHAAVALISLGLVLPNVPPPTLPLLWLPRLLVLSIGWHVVRRGLSGQAERLRARLGVDAVSAAEAVGAGSSVLFTVAAVLTALEVASATLALHQPDLGPLVAYDRAGWLAVLLSLALVVLSLPVLGLPLDGPARRRGLLLVLVAIVWWLGVPGSPLGIEAKVYLPLATAALAFGMVVLGLVLTRSEERAWPGWLGEFDAARPARIDRFAWGLGLGLALLAAPLTGGSVNLTTLGTLLLATSALALLTVECRWLAAAYAGGLSWGLSCLVAALESARIQGNAGTLSALGDVALGGLAAVVGLWFASAWLRRSAPEVPRFLKAEGALLAPRERLGRALEEVAVVGSGLTALAALWPLLVGEPLDGPGGLAGVAALVGVAAILVAIAVRWGSEGLVYLSQAGLLGAYYASRPLVALEESADAAVLVLLSYLDLGIAEVLQRVGGWDLGVGGWWGGWGGCRFHDPQPPTPRSRPPQRLFARPMLHVALVLPLITLAQAFERGLLDNLSLFLLLTAATFYGVAGLRIKAAGYAGAVLFNAFLWATWARLGWSLADRPQFFLIPVGLSAILFAEVERRALGRSWVHAIRGVGLVLMYLSLAVPIWRFQSFGAWLSVLLISLAGIFAGIGLRAQSFLWLGLAGFVVDVVYQLGRLGMEDALARWGIMLVLGLLLILFVALNEKRRIVVTLREYLVQVQQWD